MEPGERFRTTFDWKGPVNTDGWTILVAICLDQPGWDHSLANNTMRTDANGNNVGERPAYAELCGK
jgi:hypothetical protein